MCPPHRRICESLSRVGRGEGGGGAETWEVQAVLGPQGVVRNLNFSLSTEAMLHNVNSVLVFFFPQEVEFWIICLCCLCVCLWIQWISIAFRVRGRKKKKAKQLSSLKSFAEFQMFLNIFKIENILLSFLFSPYIWRQFLRISQHSICIMKDCPQR